MTDRLPTPLRDALWSVFAESLVCGYDSEGLAEILLGAAHATITQKHGPAVAAAWLSEKAAQAEAEAAANAARKH